MTNASEEGWLARETLVANVVTFGGEITQSGCLDTAGGVLYVGPGDVPDPNRPPN